MAEEPPDRRRWYASRFFQMTLAIMAAIYVYVGSRFIGPSGIAGGVWVASWALVAGGIALVPLTFWLWRSGRRPAWGSAFRRWHFLWLGLLFLLFTLILLRDLGLLVVWVVELAGGADPNLLSFTRASNLGIVAIVVAATAHGIYSALRTPPVRRVSVPIAGLPEALEGLRIVQLSDLHVGATIKRPFVARVVARVAPLEADLIAITGDLVDGSVEELAADVAPLGELRAPLGVWFVPGNHDYYSGVEEWLIEVRRLGIKTLVNAHEVLERNGARIVVAGVTDPHGSGFGEEHVPDVRGALEGAPEGALRLLLAHQPKLLVDANGFGVDLQLSGHTHGGQMVPWNLLVGLAQPVVAGLHPTHEGWIYVSRGTGFWGPPLRVGVPSEITLLELTRGG